MRRYITPSKQRFEDYKRTLKRRTKNTDEQSDPNQNDSLQKKHSRMRSSWELVRKFLGLMEKQRAAVMFALATVTVSTLLGLLPPAATKFIIDYVLGDEPLPNYLSKIGNFSDDRLSLLFWIVMGILLASFAKIGIHIWGRWYATRSVKRMQFSVRKKTFEHAVRLPLHRVYDLKSGGVASLLREDAGSVSELIFGMLYNPWRAVIQLLGSLCILAWVDWRLLLGAIILVPSIYFTHRTWIHRIRPQFRAIRARRQEIDAQATETFGGMRVVRAFSRQNSESNRFMKNNHLMGRQELFVWWWSRTIEIVWDLLIPLGTAGLMLYGGQQVLAGQLTLGDFMMFLVYLLMLLEPLATLAQSAAQFQNSLSGLDRILDLLDEPRETSCGLKKKSLDTSNIRGQITFENVSFRYQGTEIDALSEVSFVAEPGETIALVGPSGAGKTTLTNLVARFYDPTAGRILFDGKDLKEIEVESYRRLLGVVEQDVFLFDGTVAENIGYANRNASDEDLRQAAHISGADQFIEELKNDYDTIIGERGVKLSGGQRQRLAIARAILADPKILILDEATSNLDTENERLIQQGLLHLLEGRTCFMIAHRLSTLHHADRVVVLDRGRLVEIGTHLELMNRPSRFKEMVQLQNDWKIDTALK